MGALKTPPSPPKNANFRPKIAEKWPIEGRTTKNIFLFGFYAEFGILHEKGRSACSLPAESSDFFTFFWKFGETNPVFRKLAVRTRNIDKIEILKLPRARAYRVDLGKFF